MSRQLLSKVLRRMRLICPRRLGRKMWQRLSRGKETWSAPESWLGRKHRRVIGERRESCTVLLGNRVLVVRSARHLSAD